QAIEEKNSRLNLLKIQNKWREIMKAAKAADLQSQVESLHHIHQRHIDRKNATIAALEQDVKEAEEQFATALQTHCINTDTLIDLQLGRLETLQCQFQTELLDLENEFHSERAKLLAQHAMEKTEVLGIMAKMEQDFQDTEADAKHEYSSLKDDVRNKNLEEKHALRIMLEASVEDLWKQFQSALNQYNSSTEERKKQFEELKQKDQKNAKEIELQMKKLLKLQETISHYKTKLQNNSKDFDERFKALKEEKEAIQVHFQALKRKMNNFREAEHQRLTDLTLMSSKTIKELESKVDRAEKIIKLAEMNRKFETEHEKILPFYESVLNSSEMGEIKQVEQAQELLPKEFPAMEQFYKRFNKIALDVLSLQHHRDMLREENTHLRTILRQYLDGISLNEDVLAQLNPLVVVNGRTNAPLRHPVSQVNVTTIEIDGKTPVF
ncbi:coiled-coil domain-containing protein 65-like protein, partial [Zopfochytrium polystomum]